MAEATIARAWRNACGVLFAESMTLAGCVFRACRAAQSDLMSRGRIDGSGGAMWFPP